MGSYVVEDVAQNDMLRCRWWGQKFECKIIQMHGDSNKVTTRVYIMFQIRRDVESTRVVASGGSFEDESVVMGGS